MEKLMSELKSVWGTFSEESKDNLATLLGGTKDKTVVMTILSK